MADDLQDMGTFDLFPIAPNTILPPETKLTLLRDLQRRTGTSQEISVIDSQTPYQFSAVFDLDNLDDIYSAFDFFHGKRGRLSKFWIKHPKSAFMAKEQINNGSAAMVCHPNFAQYNYFGEERLYIDLNDGDTIARHVTGVVYDNVNDELDLTVNTNFDRDMPLSNISNIGRLLLARFDNDSFKVDCSSSLHLRVKLTFYELVKEYSDI